MRLFVQVRGIATSLFAQAMCLNRCSNEFLETAEDIRNRADADRARHARRFFVDLEFLLADVFCQLLSPDVAIPSTTALEQYHQGSAFKSARYISRVHALAQFLGKLCQQLFGVDDADLVAQFSKVVQLHIGEYV